MYRAGTPASRNMRAASVAKWASYPLRVAEANVMSASSPFAGVSTVSE